jgi:hypothetical protein
MKTRKGDLYLTIYNNNNNNNNNNVLKIEFKRITYIGD